MTSVILLVDDNPVTRKLVRFALESKGYEIIEASTGKKALEALDDRTPDLVLQDLCLPDIDGFELATQLRSRLESPRVPLLAFSGFVSHLDDDRIAQVGFDDLLIKPIEPSRLLQVIQSYLPDGVDPIAEPFGRGKLLLVADDDPLHLKLAAARFARLGFEVVTARDGREALAQARERLPVAIVADVSMPVLDGLRVCVEARRDTTLQSVPVILVSQTALDEADRDVARRAGAAAYVVRTRDLRDVIETLRDALARPVPAMTLMPDDDVLEREHLRCVIQKLERRVALSAGVALRCASLATELSVLAGISSALSQGREADVSIDEVLAGVFDAALVPMGALLVFESERVDVHAFGMAKDWDRAELGSLFGDLDEARRRAKEGVPLSLSLDGDALPGARAALEKAGIPSALVVPLMSRGEVLGLLLLAPDATNGSSDERVTFALSVAGQVAQGLALARAFAARTVAERESTERTETSRAIMESLADGVIVAESSGKFLYWNPAAEAILRNTPSETPLGEWALHYGLHHADKLTPFETDELPLVRAIRGERVDGEEMFVRHAKIPQGVWVSCSARPLFHENELRGGVLVFHDVTAEKAAREQLVVSDRMASIGTLAAGVAHEINNPLAAALFHLELAAEDASSIEATPESAATLALLQERLRDARQASERVRLIVKDLKMFSRVDEDRRASVDTQGVLESTLRMAWNEIRHRARLVVAYGRDVPRVEASEARLGQVFLNLLVNAAQAIPEGRSDENEIHVNTSVDSVGRVVVEIRDTGSGIAPETLRRLFTPFFTTKPTGVGTGLGLAICQRIVSGLGGEIRVETQVGVGTSFKVYLPAERGERSPSGIPDAPPVTSARRRGKILVVDDDPMVLEALQRALTRSHDVVAHGSAEDALLGIQRGERFDVILCDMMMPVVTGMDFYERLLTVAREQAERIVFLTGGAFTLRAREFLDRVPNICLEKPFEIQKLRALVNERVA